MDETITYNRTGERNSPKYIEGLGFPTHQGSQASLYVDGNNAFKVSKIANFDRFHGQHVRPITLQYVKGTTVNLNSISFEMSDGEFGQLVDLVLELERINEFKGKAKIVQSTKNEVEFFVSQNKLYGGIHLNYLPGEALGNLMDGKSQPAYAGMVLRDIGGSLERLASKDTIHGDIKPANMILTKDEITLTDFGAARKWGEDYSKKFPNYEIERQVTFTPRYVAPETIANISSPKTDLYSLGAVVFELITGRPLNAAVSPIGALIQAAKTTPSDIDKAVDLMHRASAPSSVIDVTRLALQKYPDKRKIDYQDLRKAGRDLLKSSTK